MLKNLLSTSVLIALTSNIAFAHCCGSHEPWCGTPYVGARIGMTSGLWQVKDFGGSYTNLVPRGGEPGIFAGYGDTVFPNFYMGGELFANTTSVGTVTETVNDGRNTIKMKSRYNYGASFIPGLVLRPWIMTYARFGVVKTKFIIIESGFGKSSQLGWGGQAGFGFQIMPTKHVDVRAEYTYTSYGSYGKFNNTLSPQSNVYSLALVYKFGWNPDPSYVYSPNFWNCCSPKLRQNIDAEGREYCDSLRRMKISDS